MRNRDILQTLQTVVPGSWETLYQSFQDEQGDPDPEKFYAYLCQNEHISGEEFAELHTRSKLSIAPNLEPRGTTETRYTDLGQLGEGAMGTIQVYRDSTLRRKIAVKKLRAGTPKSGNMASRFIVEAQITAQLDHPNIVPVYNVETDEGKPLAYSMKLIRGTTLQRIIDDCLEDCQQRKTPRISLQERIDHFLKVCEAMHYSHSKGVVHRDMKPENIMIGPFNEVYVMDWGIARIMDGSQESPLSMEAIAPDQTHKTMAGMVLGTPAYMSPEQAEGLNSELTGQSDQFSLGLILQELVTLKPAVTGDTAVVLISKISVGKLEPIKHCVGKTIPRELIGIIKKATQVEPKDRYQDMRFFAEDLRRFERGEAVLAKPDTPIQAFLRWAGAHSALILSATMALGALLAVVVIGSLVANLHMRETAKEREAQLSEAITAVGRQGHYIDGEFQRYQGLLDVMATTVLNHSQNLRSGGANGHFEQGDKYSPPDLIKSEHYDRSISLEYPAFSYPAGSNYSHYQRDSRALFNATAVYRTTLLRSYNDEAVTFPPRSINDLLLGKGVPLAWVNIDLSSGVSLTYPGHSDASLIHDNQKIWTEIDQEIRGPQWGKSYYQDPNEMGFVLPCSMALFNNQDEYLGVASIALTFEYIINNLLITDAYQGRAEGFLLDDQGSIMVRSSESRNVTKSKHTRRMRKQKFPVSELFKKWKGKEAGQFEVDTDEGRQLIIFYKMNSLDWWYVLMGDADELIGS